MQKAVARLIEEQLLHWDLAAKNYAALKLVKSKTLPTPGNTFRVQFNPARIVSSAARVDARSIRERACFLCAENRPPEQKGIPFTAEYLVLVNPFPVFPRHLTIPSTKHTPQGIRNRMRDMLDLADKLDDYVVFYNGPRCGASAPDHAHFQAGNKGFLPFEKEWTKNRVLLCETKQGALWGIDDSLRSGWVIEGNDRDCADALFSSVYNLLAEFSAEGEPMLNLLVWHEAGKWIIVVFARKKHRPDCFFAEGEAQLTVSPAAVDLGGVFVIPREKDFEKITPEIIRAILQEVCLDKADVKKINNRIKEEQR